MATNLLLTKSMYDPTTGTCTYPFSKSMPIGDSEISLITGSFYNSFFNVSAALSNNVITLLFPKFTPTLTYASYTLTLPDGFYSISDINNALKNFCLLQGLYLYDSVNNLNVFFINITQNSVQYKTQIDLYSLPVQGQLAALGWTVPSTSTANIINPLSNIGSISCVPNITFTGTSGSILGFNKDAMYPTSVIQLGSQTIWPSLPYQTYTSPKVPAINSISSVVVRCNLLNSPYSNPVDQLALVPIASQFGAVNNYTIPTPIYAQCRPAQYDRVTLSFADQNLNPLKFLDDDMTWVLQIRPNKHN